MHIEHRDDNLPTTIPTTEVTSPLPDAPAPAASDETELSAGGPVPAGAHQSARHLGSGLTVELAWISALEVPLCAFTDMAALGRPIG